MRAQEMFKLNKVLEDQGISHTWRNCSDTARIAKEMRKKGSIYRSYTLHMLTIYR